MILFYLFSKRIKKIFLIIYFCLFGIANASGFVLDDFNSSISDSISLHNSTSSYTVFNYSIINSNLKLDLYTEFQFAPSAGREGFLSSIMYHEFNISSDKPQFFGFQNTSMSCLQGGNRNFCSWQVIIMDYTNLSRLISEFKNTSEFQVVDWERYDNSEYGDIIYDYKFPYSPNTIRNISYESFDVIFNSSSTIIYVNDTIDRIYNVSDDILSNENLFLLMQFSTGNTDLYNAWKSQFNISMDYYYHDNKILNNCTNPGYLEHVSNYNAVNYTIKDEISQIDVKSNISAELEHYSYDLSFSYDSLNNFSLCILDRDIHTRSNVTIEYSANNYPKRKYIRENYNFDSNSDNINLYTLSDGVYAFFKTVDIYDNPISDVIGVMRSTINGETVILDSKISDGSGFMAFYVEADTTYEFTFTKTGFETQTTSLRPISGDIVTITMGSEESLTDQPSFTSIDYNFLPDNGSLNNDITYTFEANISSDYWTLTTCNYTLQNSTTILYSDTTIDSGSLCEWSTLVNTGDDDLVASITFATNSSANVTVKKSYNIRDIYQGQYSFRTFIDDIASFSKAGFDGLGRSLFGLVIVFLIVAMSHQVKLLQDLESSVLITIAAVWLVSYFGFFQFPMGILPEIAGLRKYITFYMVAVLGLSYIIRRHIT